MDVTSVMDLGRRVRPASMIPRSAAWASLKRKSIDWAFSELRACRPLLAMMREAVDIYIYAYHDECLMCFDFLTLFTFELATGFKIRPEESSARSCFSNERTKWKIAFYLSNERSAERSPSIFYLSNSPFRTI